MQLTAVNEEGLGWRETARELISISQYSSPHLSTTSRLKLCLLDTAFISQQGELERWIYTSKSGAFSQRRNGDGYSKLLDRFSRLSIASSEKKEEVPLAMLYYYSSSSTKKDEKELRGSSPTEISSCQVKRRLLGRRALERALASGNGPRQVVGQSLRGCVLQLFVRPKGGENSFIRGTWSKNGQENSNSGPLFRANKITPLYWDDAGTDLLHNNESDAVFNEKSMEIPLKRCSEKGVDKVWEYAEELKAALQELGTILKVDRLVADFVLDDNNKLWLSAVHDVVKVGGGWITNQVVEEKLVACPPLNNGAAHQNVSGGHSHPEEGTLDLTRPAYSRATTDRGRLGPRRHPKKSYCKMETEACLSPLFSKESNTQQQLNESVMKMCAKDISVHRSPKLNAHGCIQTVLDNDSGGGAASSLKAVNTAPKVGSCFNVSTDNQDRNSPSLNILKERVSSLETENAMLKLKAKAEEVSSRVMRDSSALRAVSNFEQLLGEQGEPSSSLKVCMEMTEERRALAEETAEAAQRELAAIRQRLSKMQESNRRQQEAASRAISSAVEKAEALAGSEKIALEKRLTEEKNTEIESVICKMETEKTESETNLRVLHSSAMAEVHEKMTSLRTSFCNEIQNFKARWEAERLHLASMALEQSEKRVTDAVCTERKEWEIKVKEIQDAAEHREEQALDKAAGETNAVISEMQIAIKSERSRWERDLYDTVAKAKKEESERWKAKIEETIAELKKQCNLEAKIHLNEALEQQRVELLGLIEDEKRNSAAIQAEIEERYTHLELTREEAKNSEMTEMRNELSEVKAQNLILEKRIKSMLGDAEEKAAADSTSVREEGRREGVAECRMEFEEKEMQLNNELLNLKSQNAEAIEKLSRKHEDDLSQARILAMEEAETKLSKVVEMTKAGANEEVKIEVEKAKAETRLECRMAAGKETQRRIEATKQKAQLDMEKAKEEHRINHSSWTVEKGELKRRIRELEDLVHETTKSANKSSKDAAVAIERAQSRMQESLRKAAERAASESLMDREESVAEVRRVMTKERIRAVQNALHEGESKAAEAKVSAILEAEKKIAAAVSDTMELKDQLELSEYQLRQLQSDYQHLEDKTKAFQSEISTKNIEQSVCKWQSLVWHIKTQAEWEHKEVLAEKRLLSAEEDAVKRLNSERGMLEKEIGMLLNILDNSERERASLQDILVNHKREVLISHKMQVADLQKDMEALSYSRTIIEETLNMADLRVKEAEDRVRDIEKEIASHSRQSCVGPDGISHAHKHRKRRLNEELEICMEKVEAEKAREIAAKQAQTEADHAQKDKQDEARKLEHRVVEILIEQQKKLLTTLTRMASTQNGEQGMILKKIHAKHKAAALARVESMTS